MGKAVLQTQDCLGVGTTIAKGGENGARLGRTHLTIQTIIQTFIDSMHAKWHNSVPPDLARRLNRPLLSQVDVF